MQNEICANCLNEKRNHWPKPSGVFRCGTDDVQYFHSSGNVSVPVALLEAVIGLCDTLESKHGALEHMNTLDGRVAWYDNMKPKRDTIRSMLDQIKGEDK